MYRLHWYKHISGRLQCSKCSRVFTCGYELNQHQLVHDNKMMCDKCSKEFSSMSGLRGHIQRVHKKISKYSCITCDRQFVNKICYTGHMNKHHLHVTPYLCDTCGQSYASKQSQVYHSATCGKDKIITCHLCDQTFRRRANLTEHIKHKHGNTVAICQCGRSYKWVKSLKRHQLKCTKYMPWVMNLLLYPPTECHQSFYNAHLSFIGTSIRHQTLDIFKINIISQRQSSHTNPGKQTSH